MNIPDNLVTLIKTELENLSRYELLCDNSITMHRSDIAKMVTDREGYRKSKGDLLRFCEENGIDLTEKK
jgi:hypothetical protein